MCCFLAVTSVCAFAQSNPVSQPAFMAKVSQLNQFISQQDLVGAQPVWNDINNMMIADLEYIKQRLTSAIDEQNPTLESQFTTLADNQSTYYSESHLFSVDMILNQPAFINKLNQFGANIF